MPTTRRKSKSITLSEESSPPTKTAKLAEEGEEGEDANMIIESEIIVSVDAGKATQQKKDKERDEEDEVENVSDGGEEAQGEEEEKEDEVEVVMKVKQTRKKKGADRIESITARKVLLHHCRFYEWMPDAINSISFNSSGTRVAVARNSSNIEIWTTDKALSSGLRLESIIFGDGQQVGVKTVIWTSSEDTNDDDDDDRELEEIRKRNKDSEMEDDEKEGEAEEKKQQAPRKPRKRVDRLFTGGLNGFITEWDLKRLTKKNVVQSYGGAVWDIAANASGTRLAVACEDGSVRLFDITDGGLNYYRSFAGRKRRKRVLSVAWHPETDDLWSSTVDGSITRHNIETAVDHYRIITDHRYPIWSIKVLKDNTVVSASRSGYTQFWDGNTGTLLQSFRKHIADVVTLAVSRAGDAVFSSGVDQKVSLFLRVTNEEGGDKWIYSDSHRTHTHDVKAIALYNGILLSGGVDTQLVVMPFSPSKKGVRQTKDFNYVISQQSTSFKIPPYPPGGLVSFSGPSRRILLQFTKSLQLWQLGSTNSQEFGHANSSTQLELERENEMLAELNLTKGRNLRCSALSPDGSLIACSDSAAVKLFRVTVEGGLKRVQKLKPETSLTPSHRMLFSMNSKQLILATQDSLIQVFDIEKDRIVKSFSQHQGLSDDPKDEYITPVLAPITHLEISPEGRWIASCDTLNRIHVFNLKDLRHQFALPRMDYHTTAIGFQPQNTVLGIVCETQHIFFYDFLHQKLTKWSQMHSLRLPADYLSRKGTVFRLAFNPSDKNQVILASNVWICYLHLQKNVLSDAKYKEMSKRVGAFKHKNLDNDNENEGKGGKKGKKGKGGNGRKNFAEIAAANAAEILEKKDQRGDVKDRNFIFLEIFRPLIDLCFINDQELVAVERSWLKILQALPAPLYRPRYNA